MINIERDLNRLKELYAAIRWHDEQYYLLNKPAISDQQYDMLYRELVDLENKYPEHVLKNSPTKKPGSDYDPVNHYPSPTFNKTSHYRPMLSISNVYNDDEFNMFMVSLEKYTGTNISDIEICGEPKYDGLSIDLVYRDGYFETACTRGDSEIGDDVTENTLGIDGLLTRLMPSNKYEIPYILNIRAEIFITNSAFDFYLKSNPNEESTNQRNLAAGFIRQKPLKMKNRMLLTVTPYYIAHAENKDGSLADLPKTQYERMMLLKSFGFYISSNVNVLHGIDECKEHYQKLKYKRENGLPYPIDGAVYKVNSIALQDEIGATNKSPKWAIAFKFPAEAKETTLEGIKYQVGRTGVITPVAIITPTEINGVIVKSATLHNFDEIDRLGISIGDKVILERAGDVIPKIVGLADATIINKKSDIEPPKLCPSCSSPLIKEDVSVRCINGWNCPEQFAKYMEHFVSRDAMNIIGLGESIILQLINLKLLHQPSDLYKLVKEDIINVEGFGDVSATNLINAISNSKKPQLGAFIYALGIREVGKVLSNILANKYKNIDNLMKATKNDLLELDTIGDVVAENIVNFFANHINQQIIDKLLKSGVSPVYEVTKSSDELDGQIFVITGSFSEPRSKITDRITSRGGKVTKSVSRKTTFLLAGENPSQDKIATANELGIPIIPSLK